MRAATILIVEDDPEIRQLVAELMRREGFDVEAAEDARGMNDIFARRRPDLVILDLVMPRYGGRDAFEQMSATIEAFDPVADF